MATRPCPVNALEPMRFLGLKEEGMFVILFVGLGGMLITSPFLSFAAGLVVALIYDRLTKGQAPHKLVYQASLWAGHSRISTWFPALRTVASQGWQQAGLPPPPTCQHNFDPS